MRTALAVICLLAAVSLAACGDDGTPTPTGTGTSPTASLSPSVVDPWESLRSRPLDLPTIGEGSACPVTSTSQVSDAYAPASGDGPVYPVLGDGEFPLCVGRVEGGWEYRKVLWVSDPTYTGPALIRGGQIDGENDLRFQNGPDPAAELELPEEPKASSPDEEPGWRAWPSYTRLREPGCYAHQIDGVGFTDFVVFSATR